MTGRLKVHSWFDSEKRNFQSGTGLSFKEKAVKLLVTIATGGQHGKPANG
jgi:hypothetical protein